MTFKRLYFIVILSFLFKSGYAQKYGNEWVNFSQTYFKFPIYKEGVYRIDSTTLATRFNLQTTDPRNFQLFIKGKEQFLYIKGEGDGKVNLNDHIEFYANNLQREYDSLLYSNINYLPNPFKPLFNDTVYGYLTLNTSLSNKRYQVETDTTIANHPLGDHFYAEQKFDLVNGYNYVKDIDNIISDSRYTQAEGPGYYINKGNSLFINFLNLSVFTGSILPAHMWVNYSGADITGTLSIDHQVKVSFNDVLNSPVTLSDSLFFGHQPVSLSYSLSNSILNNSTTFSVQSVNNPSFTTSLSNIVFHGLYFKYPKTPTLSGILFNKLFVNDGSAPKQSYILSNPNVGSTGSLVAYDVTNGKKLPIQIDGSNARVVIPNSGNQKEVIVVAESAINTVTVLNQVNQNQTFTNFKSTNASNAFVVIYHPSLNASVQSYKAYRQSSQGGNHQVITANINELYEQFGYGINKHPQAIRNFIKYLHDSLPTPPAYVLLIGKSVELEQLSVANQSLNLVPTMGYPASDNLLTTGITNPNCLFPEIPVGRLSALTNKDVTDYLAKVQQHELVGNVDWKKKVLHFVGGDTPTLTSFLSLFMDSYKQVIEDTLFGAEVLTFKKNTTAPIQTNISDSIKNTIKGGASLITFFGHGSAEGFDQSIDDPLTYDNQGKYPFVLANSCYSGDIHLPGVRSLSEKFVFADQEGSIGFLAAASTGYIGSLHNYSTYFYQALSLDKYGKGIGEIVKEAVYKGSLTNDKALKYTSLDVTLHGDPSLKIWVGDKPDYAINNSDVKFNLAKYVDSIGITIQYKNLGKALKDSMFVKIDRFFPNNDSVSFLKRVNATYFKDSLKFFIPLNFEKGIGLNKFKVRLDQFNEISELTKTNNTTIGTVDLFIQGGDIIPVYPYKFAVVPLTSSITLKASTTNPFAPTTPYKLQLDTNDKFINPIQQTLITSSGGVIEWQVNLPFGDSTVYFWRVAKDSVSVTDRTVWRESSFQTIGSKRGWSQAHFNQFKNNAYRFVSYNKGLRRFDFNNNVHSIKVRNGIYPNISPVAINFFYNNLNLSSWGCAPDGWNFAVFDSISGEPQQVVSVNYPNNGPGTYSNCVCVDNQILYVYSFGQNNYCGFGNWQNDMQAFLNSIAPNNYVLGYTMGAVSPTYAQVSSYSNALYNAFETIGAVTIRTTADTVPYILFGRKGMIAGQGHELKGTKKSDIIILEDSIKTKWNSGFVASEIIGPSNKWNSLHWQLKPFDLLAGDTTILKVVGIKSNGQKDTLATFVKDSTDVLALYNYVNASIYPTIQLVALMKDNINRTSPQLRKWQVLYDEVPECAINPLKGFKALNDTLQEGDYARFRIPIENIGNKTFTDSLVITYWIEDNNKVIHPLPQKLKKNLFAPGEIIYDTISLSSLQFIGNNGIWIDVNPPSNAKYQKEQEHFNNIGRLSYKVDKDITNPLLDVTFDGIRILNGDLVSAKPRILITLKDENKFLALNDTAAFTVFIKYPNQSASKRIYFAQGLEFTPANLPNNSCKINYNPTLITDGVYELTVQGNDRSSNRSGSAEYKIQFEVNNKPSITNILNYPNPFSTNTKFVFTLSGSEIPEVFTIQIMTVSGKVVKEITKEELGNIHIGRNVTEYSWDGKDEFGDKLANGVYLYKVITRLNDSSIEKSNTSADKFFVKDFGKMVIMR